MGFIFLGIVIGYAKCPYWSIFFPLHGRNWIRECLDLWDSVPNCQFWNCQWTAVIARAIKNYNFIDWECFIPMLFTRYLNMFEVSVIFLDQLSKNAYYKNIFKRISHVHFMPYIILGVSLMWLRLFCLWFVWFYFWC